MNVSSEPFALLEAKSLNGQLRTVKQSKGAISMQKIELEPRVKGFMRRHKLISSGEVVVVAVSGGADSVCLLHVLARCQEKLDIKLHVAHLNHQLRGAESEADARYVVDLAACLDVPCTMAKRDVAAYKAERGCSTEEAARELRYDFLAEVADDVGASRVAVGHTRGDQVETILMHLLRGAGTSGLRGLEPCSPIPCRSCQPAAINHQILAIRPLLDVTREETMHYCREHRLEPRIDSSNLSLSFLRNRLRLELLPLLREYNPNVDQALLRLAEIARDDIAFIEQQALQLWDELARGEDGVIYLNKRKTAVLSLALQRQLIRLALARLWGNTRDIEASHIEAIRGLLNKPVGKRVFLPHNITCRGGYDEIAIAVSQGSEWGEGAAKQPGAPFPLLQGEFPLEVPGETILPGWRVVASISPAIANAAKLSQSNLVAALDLQEAGDELFVRQRQPGDSFRPLGMDTPKKLQRFMIDAKIPLPRRSHIPLVCSPRHILWVVGWRIDDRVKVTENSREILRLEFIKSS